MTYSEARIRECVARVAACQIRCGAMQIANVMRAMKGEAMAYSEENFEALAAECEGYANEMRGHAENLGARKRRTR